MHKFAVCKRLSDSHWREFNAFILDRRTTIDDACAWLKDHGYRISRGAVWKYRRRLFTGGLGANVIDPAAARKAIQDAMDSLEAFELGSLAMFALFLWEKVKVRP